ncbi:hypothetical protein [Streptomyces sp. SID9124]|uniref:hypothetical protein n=1 Tax=Streptomyces sp. SID9124 TaxID=2706108 RepID=UPI001EF30B41|nr:hypothetical protein [Streptomyces sp. SID9124]
MLVRSDGRRRRPAAAVLLCALAALLGCDPAPTGRTPASYEQAVHATDVPMHTGRSGEKCDGKWLMMDLPTRMGPACEGATDPACSARQATRWFYRRSPLRWTLTA